MMSLADSRAADRATQYGDDARPMILIVNVCVLALAIVAVALRFVSRRISSSHRSADDWMAMVALVRQSSKSKPFRSITYILVPGFCCLLRCTIECQSTIQLWEALGSCQ